MAITVKNNLSQVLHTSGMRNGEQVTLVIPAGHTVTCDASTPVLDQHAKSRMVTITEVACLPPARKPVTIVTETDTDSPTTTGGAKGGNKGNKS